MQSAPTTLPRTPDGGLTSGIDWASSDHAVAVVNTDGLQVDRFITEHNQAGLLAMTRRLRKLGVPLPVKPRWPSNDRTAPSSRPCWGPGSPWW